MRKHFITGLILLLPLAVTIALAIFVVNFLTNPFVGVVSSTLEEYGIVQKGFLFLSPKQVVLYGSQFLILIMLFLFTMLLGMLTRWFFVKYLIKMGDYLLHRIPFINKIYKTSQDVIQTLFGSQTESFQQVVMVPFPTRINYSIGLVTREGPPAAQKALGAHLTSVFIPTTPNPTSGFLLMFRDEDIIKLDMKVEDAVKFIISCGVIHPECDANGQPLPAELLKEKIAKEAENVES